MQWREVAGEGGGPRWVCPRFPFCGGFGNGRVVLCGGAGSGGNIAALGLQGRRSHQLEFELPTDWIAERGGGGQAVAVDRKILEKKWGKKPPKFRLLKQNKYKDPSLRGLVPDEEVPACQCTPVAAGGSGCDNECVNRLVYMECSTTMCKSCPPQPKCSPCADPAVDDTAAASAAGPEAGVGNEGGGSDNSARPPQRCGNTIIQDNAFPKTDVFLTLSGAGWGLRVLEDVAEGDLLCEYTGEVITVADTLERHAHRKDGEEISLVQAVYFAALDGDLILDAKHMGGVARFANHSCRPNSVMQKWVVRGEQRVVLAAARQLYAGDEISYNYASDTLGDQLTRQQCLCGADNCSGFIGGKVARESGDTGLASSTVDSVLKKEAWLVRARTTLSGLLSPKERRRRERKAHERRRQRRLRRRWDRRCKRRTRDFEDVGADDGASDASRARQAERAWVVQQKCPENSAALVGMRLLARRRVSAPSRNGSGNGNSTGNRESNSKSNGAGNGNGSGATDGLGIDSDSEFDSESEREDAESDPADSDFLAGSVSTSPTKATRVVFVEGTVYANKVAGDSKDGTADEWQVLFSDGTEGSFPWAQICFLLVDPPPAPGAGPGGTGEADDDWTASESESESSESEYEESGSDSGLPSPERAVTPSRKPVRVGMRVPAAGAGCKVPVETLWQVLQEAATLGVDESVRTVRRVRRRIAEAEAAQRCLGQLLRPSAPTGEAVVPVAAKQGAANDEESGGSHKGSGLISSSKAAEVLASLPPWLWLGEADMVQERLAAAQRCGARITEFLVECSAQGTLSMESDSGNPPPAYQYQHPEVVPEFCGLVLRPQQQAPAAGTVSGNRLGVDGKVGGLELDRRPKLDRVLELLQEARACAPLCVRVDSSAGAVQPQDATAVLKAQMAAASAVEDFETVARLAALIADSAGGDAGRAMECVGQSDGTGLVQQLQPVIAPGKHELRAAAAVVGTLERMVGAADQWVLQAQKLFLRKPSGDPDDAEIEVALRRIVQQGVSGTALRRGGWECDLPLPPIVKPAEAKPGSGSQAKVASAGFATAAFVIPAKAKAKVAAAVPKAELAAVKPVSAQADPNADINMETVDAGLETYKAKNNETPRQIAQKKKVTLSALLALNARYTGLGSSSKLRAGTLLTIPPPSVGIKPDPAPTEAKVEAEPENVVQPAAGAGVALGTFDQFEEAGVKPQATAEAERAAQSAAAAQEAEKMQAAAKADEVQAQAALAAAENAAKAEAAKAEVVAQAAAEAAAAEEAARVEAAARAAAEAAAAVPDTEATRAVAAAMAAVRGAAVAAEAAAAAALFFATGQEVEARWDGDDEWYDAIVVAVHAHDPPPEGGAQEVPAAPVDPTSAVATVGAIDVFPEAGNDPVGDGSEGAESPARGAGSPSGRAGSARKRRRPARPGEDVPAPEPENKRFRDGQAEGAASKPVPSLGWGWYEVIFSGDGVQQRNARVRVIVPEPEVEAVAEPTPGAPIAPVDGDETETDAEDVDATETETDEEQEELLALLEKKEEARAAEQHDKSQEAELQKQRQEQEKLLEKQIIREANERKRATERERKAAGKRAEKEKEKLRAQAEKLEKEAAVRYWHKRLVAHDWSKGGGGDQTQHPKVEQGAEVAATPGAAEAEAAGAGTSAASAATAEAARAEAATAAAATAEAAAGLADAAMSTNGSGGLTPVAHATAPAKVLAETALVAVPEDPPAALALRHSTLVCGGGNGCKWGRGCGGRFAPEYVGLSMTEAKPLLARQRRWQERARRQRHQQHQQKQLEQERERKQRQKQEERALKKEREQASMQHQQAMGALQARMAAASTEEDFETVAQLAGELQGMKDDPLLQPSSLQPLPAPVPATSKAQRRGEEDEWEKDEQDYGEADLNESEPPFRCPACMHSLGLPTILAMSAAGAAAGRDARQSEDVWGPANAAGGGRGRGTPKSYTNWAWANKQRSTSVLTRMPSLAQLKSLLAGANALPVQGLECVEYVAWLCCAAEDWQGRATAAVGQAVVAKLAPNSAPSSRGSLAARLTMEADALRDLASLLCEAHLLGLGGTYYHLFAIA
jgi:hypothetical protein